MNYVKAFMAGVALPSLILPIILGIMLLLGKPQAFAIPLPHFIPPLWGFWNILYFVVFKKIFPKDINTSYLLTGAILGLLVASYGVFYSHIPTLLGWPESLHFLPLVIGPLLYAILWRFIVKPLNNLLKL